MRMKLCSFKKVLRQDSGIRKDWLWLEHLEHLLGRITKSISSIFAYSEIALSLAG